VVAAVVEVDCLHAAARQIGVLALPAPLLYRNAKRSPADGSRQGGAAAASLAEQLRARFGHVSGRIRAIGVLRRAGLLRPQPPRLLFNTLLALKDWGNTPAAGYSVASHRYPNEPAIIDERGQLSFSQVHGRTNSLTRALAERGLAEGDAVAIMCRNHRGFIEIVVALSKLGADALFLNTDLSGPQVGELLQREKPKAIVYDQEFAQLVTHHASHLKSLIAWAEDDNRADPTLEELISSCEGVDVTPPKRTGRTVVLTSGTTGAPKGTSRPSPKLVAAVSILSMIPLRVRQRTLPCVPLFHMWGFAHFSLGLLLSSTLVLQRKFDPEQTLQLIEHHEVQNCAVVPVIAQRLLDVSPEVRNRYNTSSLYTVSTSGSALSAELATRFMDEFGDIVYNLYGSTEAAWATIATPKDLREAPGTAGRPPPFTQVRILDSEGADVAPGTVGRIFVGNEMLSSGYTDGRSKEMLDRFMSTGDLGRIDENGRLFIEGREDEMIVSGGENVFPQEVEQALSGHASIAEAAVVGVTDPEWGQRLKAFVVARDDIDEAGVKSYVKENLARYKVPRDVEFVDSLPRNPQGKVLKRELASGSD
jgi:acyl-CoA synthetase (AMP-forming)/AMP-acid ligase II